ncbi:hypothetical protein MKW92_050070 [Papaver armeniacum]|nr:hypothetical protein MKW92_050070 [Papaver armeniacum]
MAKAAHLSLSPFLIGLLLVLVAADIAYVSGQCDVGNRVGLVGSLGCNVDCDNICRNASDFLVSHTSCEYVGNPLGYPVHYCVCCR